MEKGGTVRAEDCTSLCGKGSENHLGTADCAPENSINSEMSFGLVARCIVLRGHWCDTVLHVQVLSEERVKGQFMRK